jgi:hypothetical protein
MTLFVARGPRHQVKSSRLLVMAIDAPLGFPVAFSELLAEGSISAC